MKRNDSAKLANSRKRVEAWKEFRKRIANETEAERNPRDKDGRLKRGRGVVTAPGQVKPLEIVNPERDRATGGICAAVPMRSSTDKFTRMVRSVSNDGYTHHKVTDYRFLGMFPVLDKDGNDTGKRKIVMERRSVAGERVSMNLREFQKWAGYDRIGDTIRPNKESTPPKKRRSLREYQQMLKESKA